MSEEPLSRRWQGLAASVAGAALLVLLAGTAGMSMTRAGPACAADDSRCADAIAPAAVLATGQPFRARIEALAEAQAKSFYLWCSDAAMRGELDGAETALCSIGYDVLLNRHFGGNFHALLAWSGRQQHHRAGS